MADLGGENVLEGDYSLLLLSSAAFTALVDPPPKTVYLTHLNYSFYENYEIYQWHLIVNSGGNDHYLSQQ